MKRILSALVASTALAAVIAAPAGAGGDFVFAPRDCTKPKVEPRSITLTCGDAGTVLKHLEWNDWNAAKVKGSGQLYVKDCNPDCASGGYDKFDAKVTLLNIQTYTCGGQSLQMYSRAHIRFPGDAPPHANSFRSFKLFCDS